MTKKDIQTEFEIVEPELSKPEFVVVESDGMSKVEIMGFEDPEIEPKDVAGREVSVRKAIVLGNARMNINELTAFVKDKVARVSSLDVATADESEVKKAQSELNKTANELNSDRIALQKIWMQPFDEFIAAPVKGLVDYINTEKKPIADKLNEIKNAFQISRQAEIKECKDERLSKESQPVDKYIRSLSWFDEPVWLNKTIKVKKISEEVDAKVSRIVTDIEAIGMLNSDNPFGAQLMDVYRVNGGDLGKTLLERDRLQKSAEEYERIKYERAEREKAENEERERAEAEENERRKTFAQGGVIEIGTKEMPKYLTPDKPETVVDLPPERGAPESQKLYVVTFEVKATKEGIGKVISYMNEIGVRSRFVSQREA